LNASHRDNGVPLRAVVPVEGGRAWREKKASASRLFVFGGRYWDRTSGPCRVKAVLYR
jgi:hypothetical protein